MVARLLAILWPFKTSSVVRLRRESNVGSLTHKASPNQPTEGFGVLCHMKREFKPCVYCSTGKNHSFRFSRLEHLLNVQKRKSNVQVDPSFHSLHTTERPFSHPSIYIYACRFRKAHRAGMQCRNFEAPSIFRAETSKRTQTII